MLSEYPGFSSQLEVIPPPEGVFGNGGATWSYHKDQGSHSGSVGRDAQCASSVGKACPVRPWAAQTPRGPRGETLRTRKGTEVMWDKEGLG